MKTAYDLITLILFAGLAVLFLQRSTSDEPQRDRIVHYLPPALGCALANWLGNQGWDVPAIALIIGVVVYAFVVLKPFKQAP